jgi:hypothetical protein
MRSGTGLNAVKHMPVRNIGDFRGFGGIFVCGGL